MSARDELFEILTPGHIRPAPGEVESVNALLDAYRAEILREAHDAIRADLNSMSEAPLWSPGMSYQQGMDWAARIVDLLSEQPGA